MIFRAPLNSSAISIINIETLATRVNRREIQKIVLVPSVNIVLLVIPNLSNLHRNERCLQFQVHSIVNLANIIFGKSFSVYFIIFERDVVFIFVIPLLQNDFLRSRTDLCGNKLFKVANRVVWIAFDANLPSENQIRES